MLLLKPLEEDQEEVIEGMPTNSDFYDLNFPEKLGNLIKDLDYYSKVGIANKLLRFHSRLNFNKESHLNIVFGSCKGEVVEKIIHELKDLGEANDVKTNFTGILFTSLVGENLGNDEVKNILIWYFRNHYKEKTINMIFDSEFFGQIASCSLSDNVKNTMREFNKIVDFLDIHTVHTVKHTNFIANNGLLESIEIDN